MNIIIPCAFCFVEVSRDNCYRLTGITRDFAEEIRSGTFALCLAFFAKQKGKDNFYLKRESVKSSIT